MSRERQGLCPHGYAQRKRCLSCLAAFGAAAAPLRVERDLATARADVQRLHRGLREIARRLRRYGFKGRFGHEATLAEFCDALVDGKEIEELC